MSGLARCGSCQQEIRWVTTTGGKDMPLDPEPVANGNVVAVSAAGGRIQARVLRASEIVAPDVPRFMTHWATCPTRDQHRKPKPQDDTLALF